MALACEVVDLACGTALVFKAGASDIVRVTVESMAIASAGVAGKRRSKRSLDLVVSVGRDSAGPRRLSVKEALRSFRFSAYSALSQRGSAAAGPPSSAVLDGIDGALARLATSVPCFEWPPARFGQLEHVSSASDLEPPPPVTIAVDSCAALRTIQGIADGLYGRLEPFKALAWTTEELGELAQAARRGQGPAQLKEELGQLGAWVLCLANIFQIDLADALKVAVETEARRQLAKHGRIKPYGRE